MENWELFIKKLINLLGFNDYTVEVDSEHRHGTIFVHEDQGLIKDNLPMLVESFNHILQLVAKKNNTLPLFLDINNYRRERENLIIELTRATARKVLATKQEIPLPAMNSYERRLAHLELATHPEVTTESFGRGRGRYVVVKPIKEEVLPKKEAAERRFYNPKSEIA
jgi:predicted RNA-binding protein Jag